MDRRDLSGRRVGGFELGERLGAGGFATVYRARQLRLDRDVAVKVLDAELAGNPDAARRFEREGRAAARLEHPNIVPVYEAGDEDGIVYLAMRLVRGPTLEDQLREEGPPSVEELTRLVTSIAAALDHAHAADLVHRDVKPSNILLEDDRVWLADFGIAATTRDVGRYTTGTIGTASYMAPEQAEAGEVDGRADLYSLGCVVYECATGMVPYPGDDLLEALLAHRTQPIPATDEPALDEFFARALAKDPDDRFQSGADLAAALVGALGGVGDEPGVPLAAATGVIAASQADAETVRDAAGTPGRPARERTAQAGGAADAHEGDGGGRSRRAWLVAASILVLVVLAAGAAFALLADDGEGDGGGEQADDAEQASAPVQGGDATVAFDFALDDLNPHRQTDAEPVVSNNVLPTLSSVTESFEFEPNVSEGDPVVESEPSADGATAQSVRYRLRDDAVWTNADGSTTPITSSDVLATYDYILDPASGAVGLEFYERIGDIEALDDQEFVVTFNQPVAPYPILFSTFHPLLQAADLERHTGEGRPLDEYLRDDLTYTGGPYELVDFDEGVQVTLVRNESWWGTPANLDRVVVTFAGSADAQLAVLEDSAVDMAYFRFPQATQVSQARNIDGLAVETGRGEKWAQLILNHREGTGPTTEPAVRLAIAHALDRQAMVDATVTPQTGEASNPLESLIYIEEQPGYAPAFDGYAGDPDEARRQLEAAGWVEGPDGIRTRDGERLSLTMPYNADDPASDGFVGAVNAIVAQLGRVGIEAVPEPLDHETYNSRLFSGDFQTAFLLHLTNPDPSNAVLRLAGDRCPSTIPGCTAELGGNFGAYENAEVTELLHATDAMLDPDERIRTFQQIDSILTTDLPAIPLYQLPAFVAHDERLGGVTFGPQRGGPLLTMPAWGYLP